MDALNALQNLAAELVYNIVESLALDDIKSLRLVCRQLRWKAIGGLFLKTLRRQTTNLSHKSLSSCAELSRHEVLGPLVQHIRVAAETPAILTAESLLLNKTYPLHKPVVFVKTTWVYLTEEQLKETEENLGWMRTWKDDEISESEVVEGLSLILGRLGQGGPTSLELAARFVEAPGWCFSEPLASHIATADLQALWVRASQVYRLTMTALARSGIAISNLDIYSRTLGCSVPSYDITVGLPGLIHAGLGGAGVSVETLKLSLSTRVDHGWLGWKQAYGVEVGKAERARQRRLQLWGSSFDDEEGPAVPDEEVGDAHVENNPQRSDIIGRYMDVDDRVLCRDNFPGVAGLLLLMPNLVALDLHMYSTLRYEEFGASSQLRKYGRIFGEVIKQGVVLPRLRRLALRGICVSREDLLTFVERHPDIEYLALCNVLLVAQTNPVRSWASTLKEVLSRISKTPDGRRPVLRRLHLSDLYHLGSRQILYRHGRCVQACFLRAGEQVQEDWLDRGWGSTCNCGTSSMLWTRELSGDELADPACFEFDGGSGHRRLCALTPPWGPRDDAIVKVQEDTYGAYPSF